MVPPLLWPREPDPGTTTVTGAVQQQCPPPERALNFEFWVDVPRHRPTSPTRGSPDVGCKIQTIFNVFAIKVTDLLYKESVHGRDLYCGRHLYQLRDGDGSHDNSSRCGPLLTIREALCSVLFTIYFQNQS